MSAKNADAVNKEQTVPSQKNKGENIDAMNEELGTKIFKDALMAVREKPGTALSVTVTLDENDELELQVNEVVEGNTIKSLAGKAKGIFQRNKKLVLATGGLIATSVILKVIANRQTALEADEYVESSDEVSVDA